jgi:type II secretory pathway component GspD/PulD (secretin)
VIATASTSSQSQSAPAPQPPRATPLPMLPLTQLDERIASPDLDNRTYSLAIPQATPVRDVLLLVVRGTNLSLVLDPDVSGTFAGDLKNVTVRQALDLVLAPLRLDYTVDGTFVRVVRREAETRIFPLNYVAAERAGSSTTGGKRGSVTTAARGDVFADLSSGVRGLLSDRGTFNVDRKAGLLQVTDVPDRLDRVAAYLDAVQERVHRQAQIDVRILELELNADRPSLDWSALAVDAAAPPAADRSPKRRPYTSVRIGDVAGLMARLASQGTVTVLATPRLLTTNNEPALVRSDALSVMVTPQISGDGVLTLDVSPALKAPAAAESDMLVRVANGDTIVVGGFPRERETRERKAVGVRGGWFGRGTVVTRVRSELLILLTPRVVPAGVAP